MQGQANHFNRYAPESIPYAKKRKSCRFLKIRIETQYVFRLHRGDEASLRRH